MKEITPQELEAKLAAGEQVSIIDVREAEEVAAGKIPQAVNIPLSLLEFRTQDIDKSKTHFMVCRSGGRSGKVLRLNNYINFLKINYTIGGIYSC